MSLTDKEIALELTKAYLEHLNVRASKGTMHSHANTENVANDFRYFYSLVSQVDKSGK